MLSFLLAGLPAGPRAGPELRDLSWRAGRWAFVGKAPRLLSFRPCGSVPSASLPPASPRVVGGTFLCWARCFLLRPSGLAIPEGRLRKDPFLAPLLAESVGKEHRCAPQETAAEAADMNWPPRVQVWFLFSPCLHMVLFSVECRMHCLRGTWNQRERESICCRASLERAWCQWDPGPPPCSLLLPGSPAVPVSMGSFS